MRYPSKSENNQWEDVEGTEGEEVIKIKWIYDSFKCKAAAS